MKKTKGLAVIMLFLICFMSFIACDGVESTIESVKVTKLPTKVVYQIGEKFDPAGGQITAILEDDEFVVVDITAEMCSAVDMTKAGKVDVKVGYLDKFVTFQITIVESSVKANEIEVTTMPTKVGYLVGETFSAAGGKLTVTKTDNTKEVIDLTDTMCGIVSTATAGTVVVTVTYQEKTTTFNITVTAPVITSISVNTMPTKVEYQVGETFSAAGGKVAVTYNGNDIKVIDMTDTMCGTVSTATAGTVVVTVTYKEMTTTFNVTIKKIAPTIATAPTANGTVTYGDAIPTIAGVAKDGANIVDGVFALDDGQKLSVANSSYNYTFTPTNTAKYSSINGTATITVVAKSLVAVWGNAEVVATGSAIAPNVTVETGIAGETITLTVIGNTNAGNYTVTAVAVAGADTTLTNYAITNLTFNYTIANAFAKNIEQLNAAITTSKDGDTIEVAAGEYAIGTMNMDKNIIINGANIDNTILKGTLNLKNGQVKNLTLTNVKNSGLINIGNTVASTINMTNVKVLFPVFTATDIVAADNKTIAFFVENNKANITLSGCKFVNIANNGSVTKEVNEWSYGLAMSPGNAGSVIIDGSTFDGAFRTMLPSLNGAVTITNNTFRNTVETVKNGPANGAGADVTCITTIPGEHRIAIKNNTFDNVGGFYFQTTVEFSSNTVKVEKFNNFIQISNETTVKLDLSTNTFECGAKTVGLYGSEANFTLPVGFTAYVGQEKINNVWTKWNDIK